MESLLFFSLGLVRMGVMSVGALEHSFRAPKPSGRVRGEVPHGRECNRPDYVS